MDNYSFVSVITVGALNETMNQRIFLFCLTLLCYCVILTVTFTLIGTIILDKSLHEPMYILLCVFFINGVYGTTGFYPHLLSYMLSPVHALSYFGCLIQAVVLHSYAACDLAFLAAMAYDRYVAICRPLEYHSIMTKGRTLSLICFASITPVCLLSINVFLTSRLRLCSSVIDRLFCVNWVIAKLACPTADTTVSSIMAYNLIVFYALHGFCILGSYMYLIKKCVNNLESRRKFMQTCVPHVLCVFTFIGAVMFDLMYMRFGSEDVPQALKNFLSIEFILIPPIINPIIYGLKLTKIREKVFLFLKGET